MHIDQNIHIVPEFTLENGHVLVDVPVAYKTWGALNDARDNVMIICHAFTGSADVQDWWGPLMGHGKAFDPSRFFIFCANVLGSPYGTASPLTTDPTTPDARPYGPAFPQTTIRDDVRLHKRVLDHLGVAGVAVAIGGSMGGMAVLEWPLCTPPSYVRHIVPLATSARHSAWCISWGETQRQCIYADPAFNDGFYTSQPASGLTAARMAALLTYRSRDSFEARFGRRPQPQNHVHANAHPHVAHDQGHPFFSAQSYLRYQGAKFVARFDANCYIHITRKMDMHDLARDRVPPPPCTATAPAPATTTTTTAAPGDAAEVALANVLATLPRALVVSIETDGLFTPSEQILLATHIPRAQLVTIPSPDGHDGFLLEFEQINTHVLAFLKDALPEYYVGGDADAEHGVVADGFRVKQTSLFGEAEADVTLW